MKATGITRRLDGIGRLCIPKEIRRFLRICEDDPLEFYLDGDKIVIKKCDAVGDVGQLLTHTEKCIRQDDMLPQETMEELLAKLGEMKQILAKKKK